MKDTELKEIRDNVAIIFVIHEFYAEWLNSNYKEVIQTIMKDVIGYEVEPKFFTVEQLVNLMRQVVNLTRQANLNVKSLNMVMKAQINSILTIHLILSSLDLAIDFHTQVLQFFEAPKTSIQSSIYIWWRWSW